MIWFSVLVLVGLVGLSFGGEFLIRGALAAARRFGVSPLLAGLVIVGFGTSAPELTVSVDAALSGSPAIAIGNVVGSNIANILLILGLCALIVPLQAHAAALGRDGSVMIAATVAFIVLTFLGATLGRGDALIFLIALAAYLVWVYRSESQGVHPAAEVHRSEADVVAAKALTGWRMWVAIIGGLALLIAGARALVTGAIGIAQTLGLSEAVIGLSLVAVGTSLPELAVSILAALRRQADVAVGNIIGSNIFNLLGILGVSALLQPLPVDARIAQQDNWVMLGAAVLLLVFLYTGRRLSRVEGAALIVAYLAYVGFMYWRDFATPIS